VNKNKVSSEHKVKATTKYDEIKRSPARRKRAAGFLRAAPLSRFRRSEILLLTVGVQINTAKQVYEHKTAHITKDTENITK
jgi:hypothetical protein